MKNLLSFLFAIISITANAQMAKYQFSDDFETNSNGWTESVSNHSKVIIQNGVLRIENKSIKDFAESHCFVGFNVNENFQIQCVAMVKSLDNRSSFGLLLDYKDDKNFLALVIREGEASLLKYVNNQITDRKTDKIKLKAKKDLLVNLSIESTYSLIKFYVNGMKAFEVPNLQLTSNGIGFYVTGEQSVNFDDFAIIQ